MVQIGKSDFMILEETNITNQVYYCNRLGYNVVLLLEIATGDGGVQGGWDWSSVTGPRSGAFSRRDSTVQTW